jgi:hypothetical protein
MEATIDVLFASIPDQSGSALIVGLSPVGKGQRLAKALAVARSLETILDIRLHTLRGIFSF